MSQAEALLNSLTETVINHTHPVPDSDTHFIVDPYTRQIENTNYQKTVLMRGDHNSERFTFELPRYVDGHDMSLCNRVIVHFDNVGDSIENIYSDVAYMDDLRINPDKPDTVISSWLIRREATQIVGLLSFSLQYQCVEGDEVTYEWNTDSCDEIEIRKSKSNGEAAIIKYTNVLEEWRAKIFGAGDSVMSNITTEGANQVAAVQNESATQQAAIELKGSETLASIPDDYTEVYNMATEAVRTKADGIVCEAEDSAITIDDASDDYIRGLKLYGKTTQMKTTGAQLISQPYHDGNTTVNGVKFTVNPDGSVAASGTSTAGVNYYFVKGMILPAGTYTFSMAGDLIGGGLFIYDFDALAPIADLREDLNTVTFTTTTDYNNVGVYINTAYEGKVFGGRVYPMLNVSSVAIPYEPYTGGKVSPSPDYPQDLVSAETPTISVLGKNIWNPERPRDVEGTYVGWKVKGSNSNKMTVTIIDKDPDVDLSGVYFGVTALGNEPTAGYRWLVSKGTVYLKSYTTEFNYISMYPKTQETLEALLKRFDIMVEFGGSFTSYEPPIDSQFLTLNRTLHGIHVTSGGNYTDENGQQWICDEVDLDRGVCIQRLGRLVLDGSYDWNFYNYQTQYYGFHVWDILDEQHQRAPGICNQFETVGGSAGDCVWVGVTNRNLYVISKDWYNKGLDAWKAHLNDTPLDVIYARATPIETPLTTEEIEIYKTLRTNYPNTTVLNDSGAWMKVKYNADIKRQLEDVKSHLTVATSPARIGTVTLLASEWEGSDNLYHQIVDIEGVTENSQVDLTPGIDQLAIFYNKDLSFVTENDRGVVTVYAIGQKPTGDYTIQVTITEVQL